MPFKRTQSLIPLDPGQAISQGWTAATDRRAVGVTWHWTATRDLAACRRILGGANAERKGEASAHFGVGRSLAEGVDEYVGVENRSWHAGKNQTLRWDGAPLRSGDFKAARTTIGVETVTVGHARPGFPAGPDWIEAAVPNGKHVLLVEPWTDEQVDMMIALGKDIVARWPNIGVRDHHGHHDLCPGYKVDPVGFPFARVLRGIYDDDAIPDVWTPLWLPAQRQRALIALGHDLGSTGADGDWGRRSDGALRAFQRDHGVLEDGMWTTFTNWRVFDTLRGRGLDLATVTAAGGDP